MLATRSDINRRYYLKNREKKLAEANARRAKDPEKFNAVARQWFQDNKGEDLRKKRSDYTNEKRETDLNFRLAGNLRSRLNCALKGEIKKGSSIQDLGCDIDYLKSYLESKFQPGMSWENYGEWHIDHISPLSKADLSDREQFLKVCHYTNLQPLWAVDNKKKRDRVEV